MLIHNPAMHNFSGGLINLLLVIWGDYCLRITNLAKRTIIKMLYPANLLHLPVQSSTHRIPDFMIRNKLLEDVADGKPNVADGKPNDLDDPNDDHINTHILI
jgi:hypothetical protein